MVKQTKVKIGIVSITYNMMHYEGHPVIGYYVIAEFVSVQIIFGATVYLNAVWKRC